MNRLVVGCMLLIGGVTLQGADRPDEKAELTADEKAVLDLTNQERAKEKLPPLKANPILVRVARAHSANMAKQEKLEHELDGKKPHERTADAGYKGGFIGENCAAGDGPYPPKDAVRNWMESEGHKANILNEKYQEIGIGIAKSQSGTVYYTQVFARPPRK